VNENWWERLAFLFVQRFSGDGVRKKAKGRPIFML